MQQMMRLCRRSIPLHRSSQTVFISESQKVLKKSRLYFFQIDQKYLSNVSKESSQSIGEQNDEKSEYESTKSNKEASDQKVSDGYESVGTFAKTFFTAAKSYKDSILRNTINSKTFQEEWKEAVKEVFGAKEKRSIDEALSSTKRQSYSSPTKSSQEEEEYTGTSALVVVKEQDSAWQKISARFREAPIIQSILAAAKKAARTEAGRNVGTKAKKAKEKLDDAREEVLEFWETSQNPWIYRLSSLYDGFFGETSMGIAIREIRRAEPDFILEQWKEDIAEFVLPGVLDAFLKGQSRNLKKWFGEAAYNRVNIAIRERKSEGLVMDPNVLEIDNVDVIEASAEDKQAPIILVRFRSQQINCIRNREGEIVEGTEDEVLAYYYIFAFQRQYDESTERLRWRIVDVHMQRGGKHSTSLLYPMWRGPDTRIFILEFMAGTRAERQSRIHSAASQAAVAAIVEDTDGEEEEEEELRSFAPIDLLQDAGINAADIAKLKEDGFATIGQLFQVCHRRLLTVKGISEAKLEKLLQAGRKMAPERSGFVSANMLYMKNKQKTYITTGSKQLDQILGGGLETLSVTEVHGEFRTGKTQLCHTLCVTTQLPKAQGGGAGKVAYVDTEGTFRAIRVAEIASSRYNLDPSDVLENIIVARVYNHGLQMETVHKIGALFADPDQGPFKLLIVDSVTALFRVDFSGRGELSERQQRLNQHLIQLIKLAEEFNIAVLVVNQVMADPGANAMFGPVIRPIGGHVMSHAVHTRIFMKKGRGETRICKIIDSPCMPEAECLIQLCAGGVADADE
ncbi:hypothetical protein ABG067_000574 [Albugo candida]